MNRFQIILIDELSSFRDLLLFPKLFCRYIIDSNIIILQYTSIADKSIPINVNSNQARFS